MFHPSNLFYNVVRALVLPNYWATMVKIKWHVQFHFSCKIYVKFSGEVLLLKFWQCEHHSEQSKPYFESFTFMHQAKMFTKTRVFRLFLSTFSLSILTLSGYTFEDANISLVFDNLRNQIQHFHSTVAQLIVVCFYPGNQILCFLSLRIVRTL